MALIGNYSVLSKGVGVQLGGVGFTGFKGEFNKSGAMRNFYAGWASEVNVTDRSGFPNGYRASYTWVIPIKEGGLSIYFGIGGDGTIEPSNLAGGLNTDSTIIGVGDIISANLALIVSAVSTIIGSSNFSADIIGKLEASATLAGSGDLEGALGALADAVATIVGDSDLSVIPSATGFISADITNTSELSPQSLAAAVWNSVASAFNLSGTMGNKLNSAGSAGDPWGTILPNGYTGEQAGAILSQIQTLIDELHKLQGLNANYPMTVTQTERVVDDITLQIDNVGDTETTVTRIP